MLKLKYYMIKKGNNTEYSWVTALYFDAIYKPPSTAPTASTALISLALGYWGASTALQPLNA
jgi:hypothetical protein